MSELAPLLDYLAAGGDAAIFAVVYIVWKLDRRVLQVEHHIFENRERVCVNFEPPD